MTYPHVHFISNAPVPLWMLCFMPRLLSIDCDFDRRQLIWFNSGTYDWTLVLNSSSMCVRWDDISLGRNAIGYVDLFKDGGWQEEYIGCSVWVHWYLNNFAMSMHICWLCSWNWKNEPALKSKPDPREICVQFGNPVETTNGLQHRFIELFPYSHLFH